ncbi:MAG: hypothetical protein ACKV2O_23895 [Acidimicrobiales bacterium]
MRQYLVVAHQTLEAAELLEVMRERFNENPCLFHLVVPPTHDGQGLSWTEGRARTAAAHNLDNALLRFLAEGLPVSGEVGDANPVYAVLDVLRRDGPKAFDGVIVSTLPHAMSRWIRLDAPNRIRRNTTLPVTHVVSRAGATANSV